MDPRLNPQLNPNHTPVTGPQTAPNPTNSTPAQSPQSPSAQPAMPPMAPAANQPLTELVGTIPVRQPGDHPQVALAEVEQTHQATSTSAAPPPAAAPAKPHDDLDRILQAVNNHVATPPEAKPKKEIVKKIADKAAKVKPAGQTSKPIGLTVAVIIIMLILSALAFRAYKQPSSAASLSSQSGKVGTSYTASGAIQSAGGTLVRPADLDDYSQELQKQLNSLNDDQDFAAGSLSDQTLGL